MSDRLSGSSGERQRLRGRLVRRVVEQGSRREREATVLETDGGEWVLLHVAGSNPLEESELRGRVGTELEVEGEWRNGVLRLEELENG